MSNQQDGSDWPIAARTCATEDRRKAHVLPAMRLLADHYGLPPGAEHELLEQFDHDFDAIRVEEIEAERRMYAALGQQQSRPRTDIGVCRGRGHAVRRPYPG